MTKAQWYYIRKFMALVLKTLASMQRLGRFYKEELTLEAEKLANELEWVEEPE